MAEAGRGGGLPLAGAYAPPCSSRSPRPFRGTPGPPLLALLRARSDIGSTCYGTNCGCDVQHALSGGPSSCWDIGGCQCGCDGTACNNHYLDCNEGCSSCESGKYSAKHVTRGPCRTTTAPGYSTPPRATAQQLTVHACARRVGRRPCLHLGRQHHVEHVRGLQSGLLGGKQLHGIRLHVHRKPCLCAPPIITTRRGGR